MRFQTVIQIVGFRKFIGVIDGQSHDFCKVRALVAVDEVSGNEKGFNVVEYPFGEGANSALFNGLNFPFNATADLDMVSKGKNQIVNMLSFKADTKSA